MQSGSENPPRNSLIMPSLNMETLLENVLPSFTRLMHPCKQYNVSLAGAHLTVRTGDIPKT